MTLFSNLIFKQRPYYSELALISSEFIFQRTLCYSKFYPTIFNAELE